MKKLFKKMTQNYLLSMSVASGLFVVTYAFVSIYSVQGFLSMLASDFSVILPKNFFITALACLLFGAIMLGIYAVFTKLFLTFFKVYTVPYSEALFITLLVFSLRNLLLGCLNLIIVFYPVVYAWGSQLFFLLATIPCIALQYYIFDKYYIHASASPNIFKVFCFYWGVLLLVKVAIGFGMI